MYWHLVLHIRGQNYESGMFLGISCFFAPFMLYLAFDTERMSAASKEHMPCLVIERVCKGMFAFRPPNTTWSSRVDSNYFNDAHMSAINLARGAKDSITDDEHTNYFSRKTKSHLKRGIRGDSPWVLRASHLWSSSSRSYWLEVKEWTTLSSSTSFCLLRRQNKEPCRVFMPASFRYCMFGEITEQKLHAIQGSK